MNTVTAPDCTSARPIPYTHDTATLGGNSHG